MSLFVKNISYIYGKNTIYEKKALDNISLNINKNEFIGIIGHTGSGKSTLIQTLNGLEKPSEGHILYNNFDISSKEFDIKKLRQKVGLVFQYPEHQLFESEVALDVAFGPKNLGLDKDEINIRVNESLEQVGITKEIYNKSPFELSGGQQRRVAIAGVLAMKPEILILDEPTAGLDPKGRDKILELLKKLHENTKISVVLVSHSMEDIAKYVYRIIVMDKGKIVLDDTKQNIFKKHKDLECIGLSAPKITYAMENLKDELKSKNINIPENIITVKEAVNIIDTELKRRGKKR